ncbi:MAG: restriction endonuclease subunit S, partial [Bacteroidota bacterium]|nr:restriction endonuclease subunit S [Bacteroidota bacterium]
MKEGWKNIKLGDLCNIELGKTPFRGNSSYWDKEKKTTNIWLSIADLLNCQNNIVIDSKEYISDSAAENIKIVKEGTLMLSFKLTLGRLAFAGCDLYTNEAIAALLFKRNDLIDKYFLYNYLQFFNWDKAAEGDVKVKGKTLNKAKLKEIIITYPTSLSEQHRIVALLDEAFEKIDHLKANAERNLQNARELFERVLSNELDTKDDWSIKHLKEICIKLTDGTHNSPVNTQTGKYKYITAKNIKKEGIDLTNITYVAEEDHKSIFARCNPEKGDVLYIKDGATTGIATINTLDEEFSLLSSVALLKQNRKIIDGRYLKYYLNSERVYAQIRCRMDGAAITRLTITKLNEIPISYPSL